MSRLCSTSLVLRLKQDSPLALASLAAFLAGVTGRKPGVLHRWNKRSRRKVVAGGCVRLVSAQCWHFIGALKYLVLTEAADFRGLQVSAVDNRTINLNLKPLLAFYGTQRAANLGFVRFGELDPVIFAQVGFESPKIGGFVLGGCALPV